MVDFKEACPTPEDTVIRRLCGPCLTRCEKSLTCAFEIVFAENERLANDIADQLNDVIRVIGSTSTVQDLTDILDK